MTHDNRQCGTPADPGKSRCMRYIRDVVLPYSGEDCLVWPFYREPTGYGSATRQKKKIYWHRYICEWVYGAPPTPKHHAAHSCNNGPGGCVNPRHLSWKTNAENQRDRVSGPSWPKFKLTAEQVEEIRSLRGKEPVNVTAARFGVSVTHTKNIQTGRAARSSAPIPDDKVRAVRAARGTVKEIAALHGLHRSAVWSIRRGLTYRHVA